MGVKGIVKLPYYGLDIKNSFLGVILELCMYFQIYKGSGIWMWEEEDYFKIRLPNDHFFLVMNKMDKINLCCFHRDLWHANDQCLPHHAGNQ